MSAERHRRVKELFLTACDLGRDERRAFLPRECGADEDLLHEVARSSHRVNLSRGLINHGAGVRPARELDAPAGGR